MTYRLDAHATASLADRLANSILPIMHGEGSATQTFDEAAFLAALSGFDFTEGKSLAEIEDWVIDAFATGNVQMTHPGYVGLFNPAPFEASRRADMIAGAFNPQLAVRSHAIAAAEIERHVIAALAQRMGYGDRSGGHFTSGGAEANATALQSALMHHEPRIADEGVGLLREPRFYISAESHLAWLKIAHQAGLGRNAVVQIATNGCGQMDMIALRSAIAEDRVAGRQPLMIVATAGTTNAGMIDPLVESADVAADERLWLHVDAAWGGALVVSDEGAANLSGIERSDSITVDAHKWFGATMGTGMFLTRAPAYLGQAFNVAASYMPSGDLATDPYLNGYQWSRRALGLRLFMILASEGWAGIAAHVDRARRKCAWLAERLQQSGWTLKNRLDMAVACMVPPEDCRPIEKIVDRVNASGAGWLSLARFEGEPVLRFCITNGMTTTTDLEKLHQAIREACKG